MEFLILAPLAFFTIFGIVTCSERNCKTPEYYLVDGVTYKSYNTTETRTGLNFIDSKTGKVIHVEDGKYHNVLGEMECK